jgi:hypothetical protein
MRKPEPPLTVDIPKPSQETPGWSRVGVIALLGFLVGVAWPRLAGLRVGPSVPIEAHTPEASASLAGSSKSPPAAGSAVGADSPDGKDSDAPASSTPANQEMVVVGPGKILKCWDKRDKKVDDCEKLLFDPIAVKRLQDLAKCPAALGLAGRVSIAFEIAFDKKEVQVKSTKRGASSTSVPSSTVAGVVKCAAKDFANVSLEDVPHKHRRYSLAYGLTFYPPGKHPEIAPQPDASDSDPAAGATTSETEVSGSAIVVQDTALLRKTPKDGDVVARVVRGTKVKLLGKQGDWYKIESGSKAGWVYRGAIGL